MDNTKPTLEQELQLTEVEITWLVDSLKNTSEYLQHKLKSLEEAKAQHGDEPCTDPDCVLNEGYPEFRQDIINDLNRVSSIVTKLSVMKYNVA